MTALEREIALKRMDVVSTAFYNAAVKIGNHPFIEFSGLINEYIKACEAAHQAGIDFSECNTHSGEHLPLESYMVSYVNEKLQCIFTGRSVMSHTPKPKPEAKPVPTEALVLIRKYSIQKRGFIELKRQWQKIVKLTLKRLTVGGGDVFDLATGKRVGMQGQNYRREILRLR